jgi:hypothetical protein
MPAGQLVELLSELPPSVAQAIATARPLVDVASGVAAAGTDTGVGRLLDSLLLGR